MPFTSETARLYGRKGGKSRARAFTHEYQSRAAKIRAEKLKGTKKLQEWGKLGNSELRTKHTPEEFVAWGKLGAKAVIEKYGEEHYVMIRIKAAEQRRKRKPSRLEAQVIETLKRLGIAHEREKVVAFGTDIYTLDLVVTLPSGATGAIQVHGEWWHNQACKRRVDAKRVRYLIDNGWAVLTLWEAALIDPETLVAVLQGWHQQATSKDVWIVGDPVQANNRKDGKHHE